MKYISHLYSPNSLLGRRVLLFIYTVQHLKILMICIGFFVGLFLSDSLGIYFGHILLVSCSLALFSFITRKRSIVLFISLGMVFAQVSLFAHDIFSMPQNIQYGEYVEFSGIIIREPQTRNGSQNLILKTEKYGNVLVKTPVYPSFSYGDLIKVSGKIEEPPEFEEFSYRRYLEIDGIYSILKADNVFLLDKDKGDLLLVLAAKLRYQIKGNLNLILPEPHSSLLYGLFLGEGGDFPNRFMEHLQKTGTTHIISVSGYNVSIVLLGVTSLAGYIHRKYLIWISGIFLVIYAALVGFDNPPVMRAVIMGLLLLLSLAGGRRDVVISALPTVVIIMFIINPLLYRSISFQLTLAATIGVVFLSPILKKYLLREKFGETGEQISVTLAAIFATLPITLSNFESFSSLALIVNLLVLPIIPGLMFGGIVISLLSMISVELARVPASVIWVPLEYVIRVIEFFGRWGFGYLENIEFTWVSGVLLYAIMLLIIFEVYYRNVCNKLSIERY